MRLAARLSLGAVLLATLANPSRGAAVKPDVVLITADTLRADHLHCYGYFRRTSPAIDRLGADGLVFENVVAPMSSTLPSHLSMMTAMYPLRHGVVSNLHFFTRPGSAPRTAAEILRAQGYRTAAFTSATPLGAASGIGLGFDVFDAPAPAHGGDVERRAEDTAAAALNWIDRAESPFFLWIHFFDPHHPYDAPAPYDRAFVTEPGLHEFLDARRFPPAVRRRAAELANRYDGEVLYMDQQIDRVLRRLERRGFYDRSLIVFTADHGEGLLQHGFRGHGIVWNEQLRVPLVLKAPQPGGPPPGRRSDLASLVDLLPTLAASAGVALAEGGGDGVNLLSGKRESVLSQREIRVQGWATKLYTLTTPRWKYHHDEKKGDRLFDLEADPHETGDVLARHPQVARRMREEIESIVAAAGAPRMRLKEELPASVREQLRQLGYVE
jgi:arylsulfatase A-like enzyme